MAEAEGMNITQVFDKYVFPFLDNFPFLELTRDAKSDTELIVTVKVKEGMSENGNAEEYFIHVKKVK